MKKFIVTPAVQVSGELRVPSDKSISHRSVMLSALCAEPTVIEQPLLGADVRATIAAVRACGATVDESPADKNGNNTITVAGGTLQPPTEDINCGNAGTLIRLFAGLAAGQNLPCRLTGDTSLSRRPMARILTPLRQMNANITAENNGNTPPLRITKTDNPLTAITYHNTLASAQVKSAILLATLNARGTTEITEPVASRDHTEKMLAQFGITLHLSDDNRHIKMPGGQTPRSPQHLHVPADMSSAFFFLVAAAISAKSSLTLTEVGNSPTRNGALHLLMKMGADVDILNQRDIGGEPVADIKIRGGRLRGINITADEVPAAIDEMPALFIAAACARGTTTLSGAADLRKKESDRIAAMAQGLKTLGIDCEETPDGIRIEGKGDNTDDEPKPIFSGGDIQSHGDHRIAMAFTAASLRAAADLTIHDCDNVDTSYPDFPKQANTIGIRITATE